MSDACRGTLAEQRAAALLGAVTLVEQYIIEALRNHGELYGVPLRRHVSRYLNNEISFGDIYAACDRLEKAGLIIARDGEATAERGWRQKRYWRLAPHD